MASNNPRRLGRPPASNSADTLARILTEARHCFAERGYEATTNRHLAARAEITTGAIYHYFGSKRDIYVAVDRDVGRQVYRRFSEAEAGADTFVGKFEAILEVALEMNRQDPSLARFLAAVRVDLDRHAELREVMGGEGRLRDNAFISGLVDHGVTTGEIAPADRDAMVAFAQTVLIGLTDAVSDDLVAQRAAIDAIRGLLEGSLINTRTN
ncbi:MAG: TetR/AcrR family transcriptional regulator [Acidimicrobiales bacterium]